LSHAWAMARVEEGMKLELLRRRAASEEERARVPLPSGRTPSTLLGFASYLSGRMASVMRERKSSSSASEA
jgi:hypothetical protein